MNYTFKQIFCNRINYTVADYFCFCTSSQSLRSKFIFSVKRLDDRFILYGLCGEITVAKGHCGRERATRFQSIELRFGRGM